MSIVFKGKKGAGTITVEGPRAVAGTRSTCDLVVDDPLVAEEHLAIERDGDGFRVVDLRTSSGTYLNGLPVEGGARLKREGENVIVFGVSKLVAAIDESGESVTLNLKEQSFFYDKKEDPLKWSRHEVDLGRFPALRAGNLAALGIVAVLLLLCLFTGIDKPLVDPGPLAGFHTAGFLEAHRPDLLAKLAERGLDASDCRACHEPFQGTTVENCATCHEAIFSPSRHPFNWQGLSCQPCHIDHRGAAAADLTQVHTAGTCGDCHEADRAPGHRIFAGEPWPEYVKLSYIAFPHDRHRGVLADGAEMDCETCHVPLDAPVPASIPEGRPRREFARVDYDACIDCHRTGGRAGTGWDLAWHGSAAPPGEASKCLSCHGEVHSPGLKQVSRVPFPARLDAGPRYRVRVRTHGEEMEAHRDIGEDSCHLCHRDERILGASLDDRRFLHGLHVSSLDPASPGFARVDGECRECHEDVLSGEGALRLAAGAYGHGLQTCSPCHGEDSLRQEPPAALAALERRNDFPHRYHLDRTKPGLEAGCQSCHPLMQDIRDPNPPSTTPEAMSCIPCHQQHAHVASGDCSLCHPREDPSLYGRPVPKAWPLPNRFSHRTPGHDGRCDSCHGTLEGSTSLLDVPIPDESHPACVQCHVLEKARFHFGR